MTQIDAHDTAYRSNKRMDQRIPVNAILVIHLIPDAEMDNGALRISNNHKNGNSNGSKNQKVKSEKGENPLSHITTKKAAEC